MSLTADLLLHVAEHPNVVSVELQVLSQLGWMHSSYVSDDRPTQQGTSFGEQNGSLLPLSMGAVIKLVSTLRIELLGLTKTGLSDIDGELLAS